MQKTHIFFFVWLWFNRIFLKQFKKHDFLRWLFLLIDLLLLMEEILHHLEYIYKTLRIMGFQLPFPQTGFVSPDFQKPSIKYQPIGCNKDLVRQLPRTDFLRFHVATWSVSRCSSQRFCIKALGWGRLDGWSIEETGDPKRLGGGFSTICPAC